MGDWRNGVDIDEEMADWESTTRRAQIVLAVGVLIAGVLLIAFARSGTRLGAEFMASAMFFMAAFAVVLILLRRRFVSAVQNLGGSEHPTAADDEDRVRR